MLCETMRPSGGLSVPMLISVGSGPGLRTQPSSATIPATRRARESLARFQFCSDAIRPQLDVILRAQHIRTAAHLAIFNVRLPAACRFIDAGLIPLTAARALKTRFHAWIVNSRRFGITIPNPVRAWLFRL